MNGFAVPANAAHELLQIQFAMPSYCATARIPMFSYDHYPPVGAVDFGPDIQIYNFGWPAAWVDTYRNADYLRIDPLRRVAARRTVPFWWSDVEKMTQLDAEERAYLKDVRAQNFGPGLAIPVFGPNGRYGYYAAGIGQERQKLDEGDLAVEAALGNPFEKHLGEPLDRAVVYRLLDRQMRLLTHLDASERVELLVHLCGFCADEGHGIVQWDAIGPLRAVG